MQVLRTLQTNGAGDADSVLLDNWPKRLPAEGIYVDVDMPVAVGTAGTPTLADLRACLDYFLGVVNISYGREKQYKPFQAVKGTKLRHAHRAQTMTEVWNDFVGVAQTAGAKTFHARLFLTPNRSKAKGKRRLIGWTQGSTFELKTEEGPALTAGALNLTRGAGNFVLRVVPAYRIGPDGFSHLPHYREINRDALDWTGPEGKMLAVWDDNSAFPATQIGKYSLKVGEVELFHQVEPRYVDNEYSRMIDAGGSDFTDEVTLLYVADPFADEEDLPTGAVNVELVSQDVATIKGRALYLPTIDDADAIAAEAAAIRGDDINAVLPPPPADPAKNGHQATAPIEFVPRTDARYDSESGLRATSKGQVEVFVPASIQEMAKSMPQSIVRRMQKVTQLRIPGNTGINGKSRRAPSRASVRGVFASHF